MEITIYFHFGKREFFACNYIHTIPEQVEDAQAREAPVQRLADSIAGPFVYTVMTLSAATFTFWSGPLFLFFSFSKKKYPKISEAI
jgi:cation transport ATPase